MKMKEKKSIEEYLHLEQPCSICNKHIFEDGYVETDEISCYNYFDIRRILVLA